MVTQLTSLQQIQLNRVGGSFPPTPQMGDLLSDIIAGLGVVGAGTTFFVDSATGSDDNDGSQASPFATLVFAVSRFADGFTGNNVIHLIGAGPYPMPVIHPSAGVAGNLAIVGDRSNVIEENASPTFAAVTGKESQFTAAAFGGATVITDGTHWVELDLSAFGSAFSIDGQPALASLAGVATTLFSFSPSGLPTRIFAHVTTVSVGDTQTISCPANDMGGLRGVRYIGVTVNSNTGSVIKNLVFRGCLYSGSVASYLDSVVGGFLNATTALRLKGTSVPGEVGGGAAINTLQTAASATDIILVGQISVLFSTVGATLRVTPMTNIISVQAVDFVLSTGGCIEYDSGPSGVFFQSDVSVLDTATAFIASRLAALGSGFLVAFTASANVNTIDAAGAGSTLTGTGITLRNGSRGVGTEAACAGNLLTSSSNIIVGDLAGQTFASLPANDSGAVVPEGCFAV